MSLVIATGELSSRQGLEWALLIQSVGFIIALVLIAQMTKEKRRPSNIFAWSLLLIFVPVAGVPLYLVFGGRKIRRLVRKKLEIQRLAAQVAREEGLPRTGFFGESSVSSGNSVTFLEDGVSAYRTLCEQIALAQESIYITTYILGRDGIGRDLIHRLAGRAKGGVKVRLLIDALGSLGQGGSHCKPLRDAGGEVARFIPLIPLNTRTSANLRNHRKIAIFDDRRALVGGQNLDGRFMAAFDHPRLFTDFGMLIEGPAVGALLRVFAGDWIFASGQPIESFREHFTRVPEECGDRVIDVISSGPDVEGDPLWERIITLVQEAERSITIVTPYFIPDEVLLQSLIIKAHRGRHVQLIVPERSNHKVVDIARNHYLRLLNAQGVEVLFFRPRMLHAKLIIVDDKIALSGSANIDLRSLFVNFEIGFAHTSLKDLEMFRGWLKERVLPHCVRYCDSIRSSNRKIRLLAENMAHLITPLL